MVKYKKKSNQRKRTPKKLKLKSKGFFRTQKEAEEALKTLNSKNYEIIKVKRKYVRWKPYCVGKYVPCGSK
tara:strand:+ start:51 stop:263 length:213 start_codon:yes stop_codon:yes gene_type:complete